MSCGRSNNSNCCPCPSPCCPEACCPPIVIKHSRPNQEGQCCVFQLPPINIVCEIPPPPRNQQPPKVCYIPIISCEDDGDSCSQNSCPQPSCCVPMNFNCPPRGGGGLGGNNGCGGRY